MFDPAMMANMQKMMAENPGMMQSAMEMMKKNPGMMAQAQKQMSENPDMMRNAMNAMQSNPAMIKSATQAFQQSQVAAEPAGSVIEQVQRWKTEGNRFYKEAKYADAVDAYRKALARLPLIDRTSETTKLQIDSHNNLAACTVKLKDYKDALKECQRVVLLDPTNFKGLLRRGQALMGLELFERAQSSLEQALEQNPSDTSAQSELKKIQQTLVDSISEDKVSDSEQVAQAETEKAEGNTSFKAKDYERAVKKYEAALDNLYALPLETKSEWQTQAIGLVDTCHLNIAACCVNSHQWRKAILNCSQVLSRDQHKKAFFRRAQAYAQTGELYAARDDLSKALAMEGEPAREAIQAELSQIQAQIDKAKTVPAPALNPADPNGEIGQQIAAMPEEQLKSMTDMMANMDPAQLEMMAKLNPAMKDATPEQIAAMRERMKKLTPEEVKQAAKAASSGQTPGHIPSPGELKRAQEQVSNMDAAQLETLKNSLRQASSQYANMSDQELEAVLNQMKNASPEDMKKMADQMKAMSPEDIEAAFKRPGALTRPSSSSSSDMPPLVSPSSFNPGMMSPDMLRDLNAARASGNPMGAMTPELMKMSMDMMANMTPETLQQMTEMMGSMGGASGQSEEMKAAASMMKNMDPAQFKQMQDQLKNMKPEDLEKMMNYVQKAQKVAGPCMKACKPVWTLVGPCVRRTIPAIQAANRAMGGQLLGIAVCLGVVSIYLKFLA